MKAYEKSCEMIYSMFSQRVRARMLSLNLKNSDVYSDTNLVNDIINNNPCFISDEALTVIALNLKISPFDLIFGNSVELSAYGPSFFYQIMKDSIDIRNNTNSFDRLVDIESILLDYTPYNVSRFYSSFVVGNQKVRCLYDDGEFYGFQIQ